MSELGKVTMQQISTNLQAKQLSYSQEKLIFFQDVQGIFFQNIFRTDTEYELMAHILFNQLTTSPVLADDQVEFSFVYRRDAEFVTRYPDHILLGFSRVGGLLAILKIGFILRFLHERQFEKTLTKTLSEDSSPPQKSKI